MTSHTAPLRDHIYTNSFNQQVVSGIVTVDISDHFPVFCITEIAVKRQKDKMTIRDYGAFDEELYKNDARAIDWNAIHRKCNTLHEFTAKAIDVIKEVVDKHAPPKTASRSKRKQLTKPQLDNKCYTKVNKN